MRLFSLHVGIILAFMLLLSMPSQARAPEDIIQEVDEVRTAPNVIRETDITYTEEQPDPEKMQQENQKMNKEEYIIHTKFFVLGRSKPSRYGKIMEKIPEGTEVLPFRRSSTKKWIAIRIKKSDLRVWVPETSLQEVDDKKFAINELDSTPKESPIIKSSEK